MQLVGGQWSTRSLTDDLHIRHIIHPTGFTKCTFYAPRPRAREERAVIRCGDTVKIPLIFDGVAVRTRADEMRLSGLAFFQTPADFKSGGASYASLYKERRGWSDEWVRSSAAVEVWEDAPTGVTPSQQSERLVAYAEAQHVPFRELPAGVLDKIGRGAPVAASDWCRVAPEPPTWDFVKMR